MWHGPSADGEQARPPGCRRWQLRVNAFFPGLTDEYPPFPLSD